MAIFGKKKKGDAEEEVELLSDEEYDAEAELQQQIAEEEVYQARMLAEEEAKGAEEEKKLSVEDLLLKTEKIEGKLASFEEARGRIDDRIMRVSEQVGELRSMLLEREKSFGILEADFEMIKDTFEDIKPAEFSKELNKKEMAILETNVRVEKLENKMESISEELIGFRELMGKIKSFENLVDVAREINEKIAGIDETGQYTKRMAAKSESIFSELNKQIMALEEYKNQIEQTSELLNEMVRTVDDVSVKQGTMVTNEDLQSNIADTEKKLTEKFGAAERLVDRFENIANSLEFLEKRVRIMELDKVSYDVGEKLKELTPGLKQMRRIEQLTRERKDVLDLLNSADKESISAEAYNELKESSDKKLGEIKAIIREDLQSLEEILEGELGPLISRRAVVSREVEAMAPKEKAVEPPKAEVKEAREVKEAPEEVSIEDRIDDEMKRMKVDVEPEVRAKAKPMSSEELKKINEKLKLMETEEGTIRGLLEGLAKSDMEDTKRSMLEKKYNDRLSRILADIAELRSLAEGDQISEPVAG